MSERTGTRSHRTSAPVQRQAIKEPEKQLQPAAPATAGPLQKAGPAMGLGKSIQRQVAMGTPGDRYEQEADAVADKVTNGQSVNTGAISPVTASDLDTGQTREPTQRKAASGVDEKQPEAAAVQKETTSPQQQQQGQKVAQMATATPEQRPPETMAAGAVQKDAAAAAGGGGGESTAASSAIASKGAGKPLDPTTRGTLESRLGADFGSVRVHDDASARASAQALNARAFTHGHDIWLGPGASQNDTHLMAHEATHVVQQSGGLHRMVQKATPPTAAGKGSKKSKKPAYPPANLKGSTIEIDKLRLPSYDRKANSVAFPFTMPPTKPERPPEQRQFWATRIPDASYNANILARLKEKKFPTVHSQRSNTDLYYLKPTGDSRKNLIGDAATLASKLTTPTWNKSGIYHGYDVEHIQEIQLDGKQDINNMELLDLSANRSSGASIASDIDAKTSAAARQLGDEGNIPKNITDLGGLRANKYTVKFLDKDATYKVRGDPMDFWSRTGVRAGDQVLPLRAMTTKEVEEVRGDPTRLALMTTRGRRLGDIDGWDKGKTAYPRPNFFPAFDLASVMFEPGVGGEMSGTLLPKHPPLAPQPVTWKINPEPGVDYGGSVLVSLKTLGLVGMSPIQIDEVDLGPKGLIARGAVQPTIPLLKGASIDFRIDGPGIEISKTFGGSELTIPGPIKIVGSSLTVALSRSHLSVSGDVDFEIERLGRGQISGMGAFGGDGGKGFGIKGYFELDKSVFDGEARIDAGYQNDAFWAKGHLSIGASKIRGIRSASLDASYAKDAFSATGSVVPDIPAVEQAGLSVDYDPKIGLRFTGDLAVKPDTPGIGGGKLHVEAFQPAGSDTFKVSGKGSAKPKVPGFDTELVVTYDDGTFDASITAAYNKGRLKGSVLVGVTNRPVADGKPAGVAPPKAGALTVYGGGSVTVVLTPWLQGTVGVKLLPQGEVELMGEIALPAALDLFPEKKFDKNIFKIGIDIPIVGVAVAGQRIGIFATISGGLDVSAGIGPGQLQQLSLKVTYNPSHEESAHVEGDASLHVPAHAGLRLFVRGGVGAGIPIVSAEAGIELGAALGLEGALDTGVHVDWTPAKGLVLDANASVYVEPKLKVDLSAYVNVEADLLLTTIDLYSNRWQLAGFEYGSNLRFGVNFPVHYDESKGFDLSLDKLSFQVPDIEPKAILSDILAKTT